MTTKRLATGVDVDTEATVANIRRILDLIEDGDCLLTEISEGDTAGVDDPSEIEVSFSFHYPLEAGIEVIEYVDNER